MKLKVVAIVVLLVVGGAALVVGTGVLPRNTSAATTYLTAAASVADVSDDVAATGSIAASTSWSLAFGSAPTVGDAAASSSQLVQRLVDADRHVARGGGQGEGRRRRDPR